MSPSSDPANAVAEDGGIVSRVLQDGEVVILAIKPSSWFVPIVSWPVLVGGLLVIVAAHIAEDASCTVRMQQPAIVLLCVAAMCLRAVVACFQWAGRLYILTNMRVIRIRGIVRVDVLGRSLKDVQEVQLFSSFLERPLRLGSLDFVIGGERQPEARWSCVGRPEDVYKLLQQAIRRGR